MPPPQYRVDMPEVAKDQLRAAVLAASQRGQRDEALRAARKLLEGLTWLADELGESRFPLKVMGELRVAVIGPLGAVFAVDRERLTVHVGRFVLLGVRQR